VSRLLVGLVGLVTTAALVVSGCSVPPDGQSAAAVPHAFPGAVVVPGAVAATRASARPSVAVLGVKLAKPAVRPGATARTRAPARASVAPKPAAKRTVAGSASCVVGEPCTLTGITWTKTYGCTAAWRRATGRECPPGWQPLP